jgi:DNA-directed RNA polymerase subunit H (RpoH/RPB5)
MSDVVYMYRVYCNVHKLLAEHGHAVARVTMTLAEFRDRFWIHGAFVRSSLNLVHDTYRVYFHNAPSLAMADLRALEGEQVYVVLQKKPNQNIMRVVGNMHVLLDKELAFAPLEHVLCPRYTLAEAREKDKLPALKHSSIVAKWLNLKRGQVVRVTATSPTAGVYEAFRVVA